MDLYPLILKSTDLQQAAEINSVADFDTQSAFNNTCKMVNNDVQSILDSIHVIRLPLRWACYSRTKLRN